MIGYISAVKCQELSYAGVIAVNEKEQVVKEECKSILVEKRRAKWSLTDSNLIFTPLQGIQNHLLHHLMC